MNILELSALYCCDVLAPSLTVTQSPSTTRNVMFSVVNIKRAFVAIVPGPPRLANTVSPRCLGSFIQ